MIKKISIVPDTNLFLNHFNLIPILIQQEFDIIVSICISVTVIQELDHLKGQNDELARRAISFIYNNKELPKIEVEGVVNDDLVEVEYLKKEPIKPKNNDDLILNYALSLENPLLISGDKGFLLKCANKNVNYIEATSNLTINEVYDEIMYFLGMKKLDSTSESLIIQLDRLTNILYEMIKDILKNELQDSYDICLPKEKLVDICDFIINNFFIFERYFPFYSKKLIKKFKMELKKSNYENIKVLLPQIYSLFRIKVNLL